MSKTNNEPMSKRERLSVFLLLVAVKILAPWEYSHQFKEIFEAIENELK